MIAFRHVGLPHDTQLLESLLCGSDWPHHAVTRLDAAAVGDMTILADDVDSFRIVDADPIVGLIRLLDLTDLDHGSPLFDLRIGATDRGRGLGAAAVGWLTAHLFHRYERLHRIEATTRDDNRAMRCVLERCGYRLEGRLREDWRSECGTRFDTMVYGILRREWSEIADDGS